MQDFANWAFGPDGFPCLQVLASGDFSHEDRFAATRTVWCRDRVSNNKEWRPIEPGDVAEQELIAVNMDMLSACAVSPLFYEEGIEDRFPGLF